VSRSLRFFSTFLCLALSAAAIYNVVSDNGDVQKEAQRVACGDQAGCRTTQTRMERTPFAQTFELATPKRTVEVRCARSLILVGDYACAIR
jgi:hypothetical protein